MSNSTEAGQRNVLLLSTYPHGGAGVACRRLLTAFKTQPINASILTRQDVSGKFNFIAERLSFLPWEKDKSVRFSFSLANFGTDISKHPAVQSADVLHLHWWNQGLLSLKNLEALGRLNKKIVWTLHDMWAFTGGCHNDAGCGRFHQSCGQCPMLRFPSKTDLSNRIWWRKQQYYPKNMEIVTCSKWLANTARSSSLLKDYSITDIPNPIETNQFKPLEQGFRDSFRRQIGALPKQKLVLFAAMNIHTPLKGFDYFKAAMQYLVKQAPKLEIAIVVVGKSTSSDFEGMPFPHINLGLINDADEMARIYAACDVFVTSSLAENLPNTIMESMSCGTPAVGFQVGGIPEMIDDGQNGKVTPFQDSRQMAADIAWVLEDETRSEALSQAARNKVLQAYSLESVAKRYLDVYDRAKKTYI